MNGNGTRRSADGVDYSLMYDYVTSAMQVIDQEEAALEAVPEIYDDNAGLPAYRVSCRATFAADE